eukprot:CAMPEP_0173317614 /NCGR_PEP_ID=MMETSP1143-20121109/27185_1 /TAXON_ID=483371 /ORGANISM="non described non described, Strain CCMP2298" /LENGTH=69 /DNA_ID=CAMNT_0014260739 /DNA_START=92 /DNA_END=301 /DNA_ORIENTATION=-
MAPPTSSLSTLRRRLSITSSLEETFAPPTKAASGRLGWSSAEPRKSSSFVIKNPITQRGMCWATPTTEA